MGFMITRETHVETALTLMLGAALLISSNSEGTARLLRQDPRATPVVSDGVYTEVQAARGKTIYDEQCASCHLQDLSGSNQALSLAGAEFIERWNGRSVDELVERIRTSMPADRAGTLTRENSIELVAYMLQARDFPAGNSELRSDRSVLRQILIRLE